MSLEFLSLICFLLGALSANRGFKRLQTYHHYTVGSLQSVPNRSPLYRFDRSGQSGVQPLPSSNIESSRRGQSRVKSS